MAQPKFDIEPASSHFFQRPHYKKLTPVPLSQTITFRPLLSIVGTHKFPSKRKQINI